MTGELAEKCMSAGAAWTLEKVFDRARLFETILVNRPPLPTMLRVDLPIDTITAEYVSRVMQAYDHNKSKVGRVIGRSRQSVQNKSKPKPE